MRAATAQRHSALDESLAIGRPDATLEDYRAHLLMLHAWLAPLQAWLSTFHDGPQALRGEAEGPRPRWRIFMQVIRAEVTAPGDIEAACRGACGAFDGVLEPGQDLISM